MEMEEIIRQRLTGQDISVCILVRCAASEIEGEREGLGRWETPYLWQTQLLIIEFNLCFIPHMTFCGFLCVVSLRLPTVKVGSDLLFSLCKIKKKFELSLKRTWCIFCCVRWFNIPFFPPLCLPLSVFKNPVCKVYRFQTMDSKWMLVREQMEECTLSFSIPKQLLSLYIQEDMSR